MARRPKPFAYRGWYCTNAGGVPQQKLCKEEEGYKKAELALARLLVERANGQQEAKVRVAGPGIAVQLRADPVVLEGPKAKTVAEAFDEFLDHCKVETDEKTYVGYRDRLTIFYERFGTRPLRSLTYQEGLAYKKWLMEEKEWVKGKTKMKGLGPCTVNHYIRAAKRLFNWAAEPVRRFVDFNPWAGIKLLHEKPRERVITDEEFCHLLANCTNGNVSGGAQDFREQLVVLRHTTMRPGELRKLRWDYIQWDKHKIVFPSTVIKTKSRRTTTMLSVVEGVFMRRRKRLQDGGRKAVGSVFPGPAKDKKGKRAAAAGSTPVTGNSFSQRFRRLFQRCVERGLVEEEKTGETLVLYSSRHTRITELIGAGLPLKVVMEEAGHEVPATTNRYTHLADEYGTSLVRERAGREVGGISEDED